MRLGIIGLPNSGKTTLFNAVTGGSFETSAVSSGQFEVNTSVVEVPDERVDTLGKMVNAKKKVYATITYTDIGGLDKGIGQGGLKGQLRNELAAADGFLHVVRVFESATVPHPYTDVNPQRDVELLDNEFILMDLVSIENRLDRLADEMRVKGKKAVSAVSEEIAHLESLKTFLESGKPLRDMGLSPDEVKPLKGFGFLSLKPVLIVLNIGDEAKDPASILEYDHAHSQIVGIQAALEAELSQLDQETADMFMEEYGITELSASRVISLSYGLLNIHSFLTAGEKEVRAWTIPLGASAVEAAGAIHTDLAQGFIRAEVIAYDDYVRLGGEKEAKAQGKMRLESKDYIVQNGDVMVIRHNS
ncbi:redox-regulated ATPase YchF [Anaerolineales bacterium]